MEIEWLAAYRKDIERYRRFRRKPIIVELVTQQGLWAMLQYRIASAVYSSTLPPLAKRPLLWLLMLYQKMIEVLTGIRLPYSSSIGPGLYIPHHGTIIVHSSASLGENCILSHGVTIGAYGSGSKWGVPTIGNNVYLAPNAVVVGKICVGNDVIVGANSLVNRDVAEHTTVAGVPAVVLNNRGNLDDIADIAC